VKRRIAGIAAGALLTTALAGADDPGFERAVLLVPACAIDGVIDGELRAASALELETQGIRLAPVGEMSASTDALVSVESTCAPGAEIVVRATWAGEQLVRRISVADLPLRTRTRALALSLAELLGLFRKPARVEPEAVELAESTAEPAPAAPETASPPALEKPPAAPEPAKPERPKPAPAAAPKAVDAGAEPRKPSERLPEIGIAPEARLFLTGDAVFGARPHLDMGLVSVGLSVLGASAIVDLGRMSSLIAHGAVALRFLQTPSEETVSATAGPRLGLGLVHVTGSGGGNVSALSATEPYFDAGAYAVFELRPERTLRFGLGFELGYAVGMIALAGGIPELEYGGPFVGSMLDMSLAF
jgi:hypothetical protein